MVSYTNQIPNFNPGPNNIHLDQASTSLLEVPKQKKFVVEVPTCMFDCAARERGDQDESGWGPGGRAEPLMLVDFRAF